MQPWFIVIALCFGMMNPNLKPKVKIKYLLGFAYVGSLADQEFVVQAGETLEMDLVSRPKWRQFRNVVSLCSEKV